jgi:hypothetical protein
MHWVIREMHPPETATFEAQLDGAPYRFSGRFAGLTDGGTRLPQRLELWRESAGVYITQLNSSGHLTKGMKKDGNCRSLTGLGRSQHSEGQVRLES